ncbi:TonB-dependent receptor plug domain-containing protein [Luteimonas sp. S4-F44]|uniref:TonB-dependent receptor plug domain-containing protein n=1 Tax=Luteimonas sp. S4-F44 TaxID=2925842 RepID=UPI001F532A66|nr:TonB-dependent receptor plug domain-containing protein [Luteimonas sp. S4-F44]UNK43616.1 TonB-dependent receptor plug domain-containing protein [Luteimonas sp. S4-F44]
MHRLALAVSIGLFAMSAHAAGQSTDVIPAPPDRSDAAPAATGDDVLPTTSLRFGPLRVPGQRVFRYQEGMALGEDYIRNTNTADGDLATLLRINPAVQFADNARTSRNGGEIRPTDISINGAPYYQNLFIVDGASFNNDIDPGNTIYGSSSVVVNHFFDVPSTGQGIALDTELIEGLDVYDSNVPASFGGFTGGVVDARTRRARDTFSGKAWFRMARSAWDKILVAEGNEAAFADSTTYIRQPNYDKQKFGLRLEGRTEQGLGIIGTITQTRSTIPLKAYSTTESIADANSKEQTRKNTAISLNIDWANNDGVSLNASLQHAPSDDRYFIVNQKDSWMDLESGGPVMSFRADFEHGAWRFGNAISYSDVESSRATPVDYWKSWAHSEDKYWNSASSNDEGSGGAINQHDRKIAYKFSAMRDSFMLGGVEHTLSAGFGYQQRKAFYERPNVHSYYYTPTATTSCTLSDGAIDLDTCSLAPVTESRAQVVIGQGQYLARAVLYRAGSIEVEGDEWNAWVQDDIRMGNWSVRPGLRFDDDSIWGRPSVAPRLSASWDVLDDGRTILTGGVNRYYGRNFFTYLMREARGKLATEKRRTSAAQRWDEVVGTVQATDNRISDLDIPYTDEWTIGIRQQLSGFDFNLKYVNRESRRQVLRQSVRSDDSTGYYKTNVYEYNNNGRSASGIYSLTVTPTVRLNAFGSSTGFTLALDQSDVRRNYNDYDTVWNEDAFNELIVYKGDVISRYDIPATNFNRPWTARLSTQTRFEALGLSWSNFFRYRAGYRDIGIVDEAEVDGAALDVYDDVDYPRSWTWDSTIEYDLPIPRIDAYVRVEATNVFNRMNRIVGTTATGTYYEPGRSYWLELGYRF